MSYLLMAAIGYLIGCLQFAYIFGRVFRGIDIMTLGMTIQSVLKHLPNLKRISMGEENGLRGTIIRKRSHH
ncbi:hypothetical protein [Gudongella oleilytica]|uniref:hypothetical protein n=1 Tax=Gudongella oleilytica TaxID=1582259 RepID=UPI000FF8B698|nr:hypothetical protein [Gudongella oleilytica]